MGISTLVRRHLYIERPRLTFHYHIRRLIMISREAANPRNLSCGWSNHSEIRHPCYLENLNTRAYNAFPGYTNYSPAYRVRFSRLVFFIDGTGLFRYSDVIMGAVASQITSVSITQPFVQAQIKENIKVPRHCPLWGEFIGDQWISSTKDR